MSFYNIVLDPKACNSNFSGYEDNVDLNSISELVYLKFRVDFDISYHVSNVAQLSLFNHNAVFDSMYLVARGTMNISSVNHRHLWYNN